MEAGSISKRVSIPVFSRHLPKFESLQLLRVIAAVMVVCLHATFYVRERLLPTENLWAVGRAGVDIFFVLSGFVMVYTSQTLLSTNGGWKVFAERRIARILPLYWIALTLKVLTMVVSPHSVLHAHLAFWPLLSSYCFLPSYNADHQIEPILGVGWTLNFEMVFYALFTLALLKRWNIYRFIGTVLAILSLAEFFRRPSWPAIAFYCDSITLEFVVGMLIARLALSGRKIRVPYGLALVLLGSLLMWMNAHGSERQPSLYRYGIPAGILVLGGVALEPLFKKVPTTLLFLADASYAIYLFHPMFAPLAPALFAKKHMLYPEVAIILSVLTALIGGSIVHWILEAPINEWIRQKLKVRHQRVLASVKF